MLCKSKYNAYLVCCIVKWQTIQHIRSVASWVVSYLPIAIGLYTALGGTYSGSYSVTSVVLSPQTKNSDKESYVRRKIQALTIRVVNLVRHIILKSQIHTLTQWGRLEFVCKDRPFLLFFNMLYPRYDAKEPDMFNS